MFKVNISVQFKITNYVQKIYSIKFKRKDTYEDF